MEDPMPDPPHGARWHANSDSDGWIALFLIDNNLPEDIKLIFADYRFCVGLCGTTPKLVASMARLLIHRWNGTKPPSPETLAMVEMVNAKGKN